MDDRNRDWRGYWGDVPPLETAQLDDALKQVGKTQMGVPVGADQLDLILASIRSVLELQPTDHLVDLGCGNGLVTERVCAMVASVVGIDVSTQLIADANRFRATDSLKFEVGDFADPSLLESWPGEREVGSTWKWYSYEVIQHLNPEELRGFLEVVAGRFRARDQAEQTSLRLFLGSIPDQNHIRSFYNTPERWALYESNLAKGVEQIGTWWQQEELEALANDVGFACEITAQDPALYTAHYRFNALLTYPGGEGQSHD